MHFVSISTLAVALASSAMAANAKFDVTPVEEGVQGIIKSNDGETCLDNYGAQSRTGECGVFQSVGKGGLWSPKGFLAFNGENITIASGQPEYTWEGVELPSQIGTTVYGLAVYKDGEIVEGPGWSPVLGETFSSPREDFVTEHLMFYQSLDGKYW